uniref:Uncharacterized protein n=1 Tax=Rhizophora mucronata TaxID=61149 RepID=A0A2P2PJV5_RHIMU
MSFYWDKIFSV